MRVFQKDRARADSGGRHPRTVALVLIALVALLPPAAFSIFAVIESHAAHRASEEARLRDTSRALASALDAQLGAYIGGLTALSISGFWPDELSDAAAIQQRVTAAASVMNVSVTVTGPAPEFRIIASSDFRPDRPRVDLRPPEIAAELHPVIERVFRDRQPVVANSFIGTNSGQRRFAVYVPIQRDGAVPYVLSFGVEPSALQTILDRQDLGPGVRATIADGNGRIVASAPQSAMASLPAMIPNWTLARHISGPQVFIGSGLDGSLRVIALEPLARAPGWAASVSRPEADIRAAAWANLRWVPLGGIAFMAAALLLAWAGRRQAKAEADRESSLRQAAEAATRELDSTLSNAPVAVYRAKVPLNGEQYQMYRSPAFLTVTGWDPAALDNRSIIATLAPDEGDIRSRVLAALRKHGRWHGDMMMRRPDGTRFWGRVASRVIGREPDGTIELIGFIQDATHEREAEQRVASSSRLAALGEMAAGIAHELRQPLAAIMMAAENAQLALGDGEIQDAVERLDRIINQADRTSQLIEHLRQFARGVPDGAAVDAIPLDVIVTEALELLGRAMSKDGVEVRIDLGDPPPRVQAHRMGLEQVLINLLLNARDALCALPPDRPRFVTLEARADEQAGVVRLAVADSGNGIPPDILTRLFQPFVTSKGPDRGTGIGLATCFGLMSSMGGTIEGANAPDGGAVFTLSIPLAR